MARLSDVSKSLELRDSIDMQFDVGAPICFVHPIVILSMIENHMRRSPEQQFVIGTIFGPVVDNNRIEIIDVMLEQYTLTNNELAFNLLLHDDIAKAKMKLNPQLQILGLVWTTIPSHNIFSKSDIMTREKQLCRLSSIKDIVHIFIDATSLDGNLAIKAYVRSTLGNIVRELPLVIRVPKQDAEAVSSLILQRKRQMDIEQASKYRYKNDIIQPILNITQMAEKYLTDVLEEHITMNLAMGRQIRVLIDYLPDCQKNNENDVNCLEHLKLTVKSLIATLDRNALNN